MGFWVRPSLNFDQTVNQSSINLSSNQIILSRRSLAHKRNQMVWYLSCVILEILNELRSAPNPLYKVLSFLPLPIVTDVCGCIWLFQMYHPVRTINTLPVTSSGAWQIHRYPVQEVAWLHDKLFSPTLYLPPHILANHDLKKQSCGMNSAKCSCVHRGVS